ncbi:hypothetical protein KIN20_010513 [Parelaphostrongylus tenuis]|uniref:Uncharacterized protein n=1 Tax=Parelaphostrongylus tenuis TaxID=148309 RepID=A0AAD5M7Y7_PARTN|nr:hypothetical protein KIN20_010513 [Parelaphostrongylus tenuis]
MLLELTFALQKVAQRPYVPGKHSGDPLPNEIRSVDARNGGEARDQGVQPPKRQK